MVVHFQSVTEREREKGVEVLGDKIVTFDK